MADSEGVVESSSQLGEETVTDNTDANQRNFEEVSNSTDSDLTQEEQDDEVEENEDKSPEKEHGIIKVPFLSSREKRKRKDATSESVQSSSASAKSSPIEHNSSKISQAKTQQRKIEKDTTRSKNQLLFKSSGANSDDTVSDVETETEIESGDENNYSSLTPNRLTFVIQTPIAQRNVIKSSPVLRSIPHTPGTAKMSVFSPTGKFVNHDDDYQSDVEFGSPSRRKRSKVDLVGKPINGFRMIGTANNEDDFADLASVDIDLLLDPYKLSYETEFTKQPIKDPLEEKYNRSSDPVKALSYNDYLQLWSKKDALIWPSETTTFDDIDRKSLQIFFKNGSKKISEDKQKANLISSDPLEIYKNIIKYERVRWHPDKMVPMLQNSGVIPPKNDPNSKIVISKITNVFQHINSLHEEVN